MLKIITIENPNVPILVLEFRGVLTRIDVRKMIATGKGPISNITIAHKDFAIAVIGEGIQNPPFETFEKATKALKETNHHKKIK